MNSVERVPVWGLLAQYGHASFLMIAFIVSLSYIAAGSYSPFIYFRF